MGVYCHRPYDDSTMTCRRWQCHSASVEKLQRETDHSTASLALPRQSEDVPLLNECPRECVQRRDGLDKVNLQFVVQNIAAIKTSSEAISLSQSV